MKKRLLLLCCGAVVCGSAWGNLWARPPYYSEFKVMYLQPNGSEEDKEYARKVEKHKCAICHGKNRDGKEDKKVRNSYGLAVQEFVIKEQQKDREKIRQWLDEAAKAKLLGRNETFGERIKNHKLPAPETEGD